MALFNLVCIGICDMILPFLCNKQSLTVLIGYFMLQSKDLTILRRRKQRKKSNWSQCGERKCRLLTRRNLSQSQAAERWSSAYTSQGEDEAKRKRKNKEKRTIKQEILFRLVYWFKIAALQQGFWVLNTYQTHAC